jgi:predicted GH43/DUF377 family glycosyl hydrolase
MSQSLLLIGTLLYLITPLKGLADWQIGPFNRVYEANPILTPCKDSLFHCPIQNKSVTWESDHVFNPGAVVRNGKVYLIYRAEDDYGQDVGYHTSRLGLAESHDGIHFKRMSSPILFPDHDDQKQAEFPGGCEDPRIVETEEGTYVMTYTQWNQDIALLAIATSADLLHWKKHGYAFQKKMEKRWCKSGSIVCQRQGDRLVAAKIKGKYWMYWGEGNVNVAVSDDLINWEPLHSINYELVSILKPRPNKFDSALVESGPPAILTDKGIVFLYNGKNASENGDPTIPKGAYSAGQALFDSNDPTHLIARSEKCFLTPEKTYEREGQYQGGTVFIQGLVHFNAQWILYYGTADSARLCYWRCGFSRSSLYQFREIKSYLIA